MTKPQKTTTKQTANKGKATARKTRKTNKKVATKVKVRTGRPPMTFLAKPPKGKQIRVEGIQKFAKQNHMDAAIIRAVLDGKKKSHHGWTFRNVKTTKTS